MIARTSAFAFKGKHEDIRQIARALGVTNVLEGSVRKAGNRIRVTAQLITAADGSHLWSERYDRELADVFAVQDEIAAAITGALQVTLSAASMPVRRRTRQSSGLRALSKGALRRREVDARGDGARAETFRTGHRPRSAVRAGARGTRNFFLPCGDLRADAATRRAAAQCREERLGHWRSIRRCPKGMRCWGLSRRCSTSTGQRPSGISRRRCPAKRYRPWCTATTRTTVCCPLAAHGKR